MMNWCDFHERYDDCSSYVDISLDTQVVTIPKKPRMLVIRGLGSTFDDDPKAPAQLYREYPEYEIDVINYRQQIPRPKSDYSIVVGHSAGATRSEMEFGGMSNVTVISMASPTRMTGGNIHQVTNPLDPVSVLGGVLSAFRPEKIANAFGLRDSGIASEIVHATHDFSEYVGDFFD